MAEKRSLAFGFLGEDLGLGRTLKGLAKDSEHAHSSLSKLGKIAIGAGAVAGVTLLTKKVVDFGKDTVDSYTGAAKSAGALQRVLGGTVEDASRLSFAAHESGVSEESFAKSVRLLEKNLGAATKAQVVKTKSTHQEIVTVNRLKDGHIVHVKALKNVTDWTAKTVTVSKNLGFTYKDTHGKMLPMRDIMLNVADKFQHMPNGVEKTALALKLFGRAGTDMIPMLNKGREGVAELMKESDKLGTTMSGKDVKSVKEYTMQQRHLHAAMEGLKITIGRELFPIFTAWSDSLAKNAPKIIAWVKDHLPGFRREAKKVADFIKTDLEPAVANFTKGLVDKGGQFAKDVQPFFHWLGDHPDMLKQIAKDAVLLGAALKARTFIMGLGLLKGAGGARLGGVAGGVGGKAGATPVYVTNPGFGAGGVGGKTPPVVAGGGGPKGPVLGAPLIIAAVIANKKVDPKNAAERVLDDPKTKKELGETPKERERKAAVALSTARVGAAADRFLDDPKRGRAARNDVTDFTRGVVRGGYAQPVTKGDIVRLLTPGAKPSVTNNYYNINAYGADLNKVMAQAHRQARIHAVGSVNNAATRDRNG